MASDECREAASNGDILVVEEDSANEEVNNASSKSVKDLETDSSSDALDNSSDDSEVDANPTALRPIRVEGVSVNQVNTPRSDRPGKAVQRRKKLTRKERGQKIKNASLQLLLGYVKPDITKDKEKERKLAHIATKGVTQLFNKVADRQKELAGVEKKKLSDKRKHIVELQKRKMDSVPVSRPELTPSQLLKMRVPMTPTVKIKNENKIEFDLNETVTNVDLALGTQIKVEPEFD